MASYGIQGQTGAAAGTSAGRNPPTPKPPRTAKPPAPTDPFAPLTPAQIQQVIGKYTSGYGVPQTTAQIQASAQGMLDPIIQAITANINKQTGQATAQLQGNATSLAKALAGVDYGAPYVGAEDKQAAVDAALQQSLTGGGQQLSQDLQTRLGAIGGPAVPQAAAGIASRGAAIGTEQQAVGSSALSNLIANEAAARNYGQQLPGLAQERGLQDVAAATQAGAKQIGDQTSQIMAQLPGIVENLRNAAQSLSGEKAKAAADLYTTLTGQNITKATASAGLGLGYKKAQDTAATAAAREAAAAAAAATKAGQPDPSLSRVYGHVVDSNGNPIVGPGGQPIPVKTGAKGPKAPKPLTASELRSTAATANTIAEVAYKGGTDSKGNVLKPLDYQGALGELRNAGVLADPRAAKVALGALNRWYGEGVRGRPYASPQAKFKAQSSQRPTVGQTSRDASGATYAWNGRDWVKK